MSASDGVPIQEQPLLVCVVGAFFLVHGITNCKMLATTIAFGDRSLALFRFLSPTSIFQTGVVSSALYLRCTVEMSASVLLG